MLQPPKNGIYFKNLLFKKILRNYIKSLDTSTPGNTRHISENSFANNPKLNKIIVKEGFDFGVICDYYGLVKMAYLPVLTKEGQTFKGWSYTPGGESATDKQFVATKEVERIYTPVFE